ncbi:hypothetical protein [Streptomyces sp.]|uniref:hypothetical protein n=1 Tax=Streptomyces sp. TaxID=1931 RepID=UPI002F946B44
MPATLIAAHISPAESRSLTISVEDLSNMERAVALYASDMPTSVRRERRDDRAVAAWIIQGAIRLGLEELYRSAAYLYGYRLLWLADLTTDDQRGANQTRFPNARRLDRAEQIATSFTVCSGLDMTQEAMDRRTPKVEGACLCGGTGWIKDIACPGHNPTGRPAPVVLEVAA